MATADRATQEARPRLVGAAPVAVVAAFLLVVPLLSLRPVGDPDAWWHLRLGADLARTRDLTDPPAWTRFATQPWVPTQWLPEVVASGWEQRLGLPGLVWLLCAAIVVLLVTVYVVCRREAGPLPAALATVLAAGGTAATLTPRPQVVSLVLLTVALGGWLQTSRDLRPRWWLVPLTWLWACSHGLWFSGVAVGVAVTAGLWLDRRVSARQALRLLAVPLLSVVAAALTPVGPRLLAAPVAVSRVAGYIMEWQTPSFRDLGPVVTAAMLGAVVLAWARCRERLSFTTAGLLLLAALWTLLSARTVALGALTAAPLLAGALARLVSGEPSPRRAGSTPAASTPAASTTAATRVEGAALAAAGTLALVVTAALAALLPALRSPADVPLALDPALDRLPPQTVVWNDYAVGGWLDWRHPTLQVVVDGRAEAFGAAHLQAYGRTSAAQPGWDETLRSVGAHVALVKSDSALADALEGQLAWRSLGTDGGYVLLSDGTLA